MCVGPERGSIQRHAIQRRDAENTEEAQRTHYESCARIDRLNACPTSAYSGLQTPRFTAKAASDVHFCPCRCSRWKLFVALSARPRQSASGAAGARLMRIDLTLVSRIFQVSPPSLVSKSS